jgi:predicted TIM-barrel fold metal-dependent hydrolase
MLATAGGIYSQRMLQASLDMLGANRIFMGTDDPFQQRYLHGEARTFIAEAQLAPDDRAKLSSLNAQRVLFKCS